MLYLFPRPPPFPPDCDPWRETSFKPAPIGDGRSHGPSKPSFPLKPACPGAGADIPCAVLVPRATARPAPTLQICRVLRRPLGGRARKSRSGGELELGAWRLESLSQARGFLLVAKEVRFREGAVLLDLLKRRDWGLSPRALGVNKRRKLQSGMAQSARPKSHSWFWPSPYYESEAHGPCRPGLGGSQA